MQKIRFRSPVSFIVFPGIQFLEKFPLTNFVDKYFHKDILGRELCRI